MYAQRVQVPSSAVISSLFRAQNSKGSTIFQTERAVLSFQLRQFSLRQTEKKKLKKKKNTVERGRIQEDCHRNKSAIEIEEKKGNCSRKRKQKNKTKKTKQKNVRGKRGSLRYGTTSPISQRTPFSSHIFLFCFLCFCFLFCFFVCFCLVQCLTESSTEIRPLLILLEKFARLADEPCFPHISH